MKKIILGSLFLSFMLCACSTNFANKDIFDRANDALYSSIEKGKATPDTLITYIHSSPFGSGFVGYKKITFNKNSAKIVYYSKMLRDGTDELSYDGSKRITLAEANKIFSETLSEIKRLKKQERPSCEDGDFYKAAVWYKGEYYFYIGETC